MLLTLRMVVVAAAGGLLVIGNGLYALETESAWDSPPLWVVLVQLGGGLVVSVIIETTGHRLPPVPPGTPEVEARRRARTGFTMGTILRAALAVSIAIASLSLGFAVAEGTFVTYLIGAALSLLLLAAQAWPSSRNIRKAQESLERDGARSYLREELGLGGAGPIQEL